MYRLRNSVARCCQCSRSIKLFSKV